MRQEGGPSAPAGDREWRTIGASLKRIYATDDRSFDMLLKAFDAVTPRPCGPTG